MLSQFQQRNAFLSELQTPELALLQRHLVPLELSAGDRLHDFGKLVEDVIFLHSGLAGMTIPLCKSDGAGAVLVGREGVIGGFAAAASIPAICDTAVYIAGQASRISASVFRRIVDQSAPIRHCAARYDTAMLAQAQQTAMCNAVHPVAARVCRWLLEIQDRNGSNQVPLTQSTLAQLLGVRRTTVTLVAGRLEDAGVLRCRRGYMEIVSPDELKRHSCDCYAHLKSCMATLYAPRAEAATTHAATTQATAGTRLD